jgi:hypothetical protein
MIIEKRETHYPRNNKLSPVFPSRPPETTHIYYTLTPQAHIEFLMDSKFESHLAVLAAVGDVDGRIGKVYLRCEGVKAEYETGGC